MHFSDLSPYRYAIKFSPPNVVNVGWLDRSMPYSRGSVPSGFADQLRKWFVKARVNQMRGLHECNFCRPRQWPLLPLEENPDIRVGDKRLFLGNWEIWIPGANDKVYASPALIIHYIEEHAYCPPEEFMVAVMSEGALLDWQAEVTLQELTTRHVG